MSKITSIFCSSCKNAYDDSKRRPRLGDCFHIICDECQTKRSSTACFICGKAEAFKDNLFNYQLIEMFKTFKETLTQKDFEELTTNPENKRFGLCVRCKSTECLRVCMTCCSEKAGFKKRIDGVYEKSTEHMMTVKQSLESCILCANCFEDNHPSGHISERLSHIAHLTNKFQFYNFLIFGILLEDKLQIKEEEEGEYRELNEKIIDFQNYFNQYTIFLEGKKLNYFEYGMIRRYTEQIQRIPELAEAREKSLQLINVAANSNQKLRERILVYKKEEINRYIQMVNEKLKKQENDADLMKIKTQIIVISNKYDNFQMLQLSPEEIEEIDAKIEEKMNYLEKIQREKYPVFEEEVPKFFKFRALMKEIQNVRLHLKEKEEALMKETEKLRNFSKDRLNTVEEFSDERDESSEAFASSIYTLFLFELTDKSFVVDQMSIDYLEERHRSLQTRLMILQFFSGTSNEDKIFEKMLTMQYEEEQSWLHQLLNAVS